jgi:N-acetylglutamate synthase-like GNAT family acetyltransferase
LKIRNATKEDADAIKILTREAYAKWIPLIGREPLPMTVDYHDAVEKHLFRLAHVGDTLAALIETAEQADHVLIENLAVSPAFQGNGFGRKLLALVEDTAKGERVTRIKLYTNKLFVENIEFYSRHGYTIDCEKPLKGGIVVYMSKSLAQST